RLTVDGQRRTNPANHHFLRCVAGNNKAAYRNIVSSPNFHPRGQIYRAGGAEDILKQSAAIEWAAKRRCPIEITLDAFQQTLDTKLRLIKRSERTGRGESINCCLKTPG